MWFVVVNSEFGEVRVVAAVSSSNPAAKLDNVILLIGLKPGASE